MNAGLLKMAWRGHSEGIDRQFTLETCVGWGANPNIAVHM
jgi:hypothetical protein